MRTRAIKPIPIIVLIVIAVGISTNAFCDDDSNSFLNKKISLSVDNSQIGDVIKLLARQNGFNVSVAGENFGTVSFMLKDVPLSEALNAILTPRELSWYVRNNVLVVKSAESITPDEIRTEIVELKYISAYEAKLACEQVLSENGKIVILSESEMQEAEGVVPASLAVSDYDNNVTRILRIIEDYDRPRPQINISVKLVETTISGEKTLGLDFPESFGAVIGSLQDEDVESSSIAIHSLDGGSWVWGKFSADEVSTALDLLLQSGNSKILSDPNLTTVSNKPAEIAVTTTIPIQTLNRFTEGAVVQDIVSFQDLDVGITLRVIPRLNDSGVITLKVNPIIEEIIGYTGPVSDQRPITSNRSMTTEVRVRDNETLVMGGLFKENEFKTVKKIPILGSIPFLGPVFQHQSSQTEKTDLTIFITPRIIAEAE